MTFGYNDNRRLETVTINRWDWEPLPAAAPVLPLEALTEQYAYNVFGERVGILQCPAADPGACKPNVRVYDFVDGQLQVERESDDIPGAAPITRSGRFP